MEDLKSTLNRQLYSYSSFSKKNNSNSTVEEAFNNLKDVIPEDDYMPFYVARYRDLGPKRFYELANKARATGRDSKRLFFWMLKNNQLVK